MIDTLVFDLETTALTADEGAILCAAYESSRDPGVVHVLRNDRVNAAAWKRGDRGDDRELVKQMNEVVRNHDLIVAHNGRWFDIPWLRTRAIRWKLQPLRAVTIVDPVLVARRSFRLKSNGLARLADFTGLSDKKTPLDMSIWADVVLRGDARAMDLIVKHCVADVKVLSGVLNHVKPFIKQFDSEGSAR